MTCAPDELEDLPDPGTRLNDMVRRVLESCAYRGCLGREEFEGEEGCGGAKSGDFVCNFLHCRDGHDVVLFGMEV